MTEAVFDSMYTIETTITIILKAICILALSKYIIINNGGKTNGRRNK